MCGRTVRIHEDATWGMVLDGPILWFAAGQHLLGGDGPSRHEGHKEDRESKLPTEIGHGSTPSEFGCPALCDSRELMRGAVPCQTRSLPTITGLCPGCRAWAYYMLLVEMAPLGIQIPATKR